MFRRAGTFARPSAMGDAPRAGPVRFRPGRSLRGNHEVWKEGRRRDPPRRSRSFHGQVILWQTRAPVIQVVEVAPVLSQLLGFHLRPRSTDPRICAGNFGRFHPSVEPTIACMHFFGLDGRPLLFGRGQENECPRDQHGAVTAVSRALVRGGVGGGHLVGGSRHGCGCSQEMTSSTSLAHGLGPLSADLRGGRAMPALGAQRENVSRSVVQTSVL